MSQPLNTEPRDLLLDATGNLVIENGDLVLVRGIDGVAQSCRIALQMFEEEWFLDLDVGIPYFQEILGHKADVAVRAAAVAFTAELLAVSGVIAVTQMDVEQVPRTRGLKVTWRVRTDLGDTPADTINLGVA
jgi:hypothetical protein